MLKSAEQIGHIDFLVNHCPEFSYRNTNLLHCVAVTDSDAVVIKRIVVDGHAERGSDGILAAISLADAVLLVVLVVEVVFDFIHYFLGEFRESVLLDERKDCDFYRGERGRNAEHNPGFSAFKLLYVVGM